MPLKTSLETLVGIIPSVVSMSILGLLGTKLAIAILFGLITKIILIYFDKEIKEFTAKLKWFFKRKK